MEQQQQQGHPKALPNHVPEIERHRNKSNFTKRQLHHLTETTQ